MPDITKTPGNDEGVQFNIKKLAIHWSCWEGGLLDQTLKINVNS